MSISSAINTLLYISVLLIGGAIVALVIIDLSRKIVETVKTQEITVEERFIPIPSPRKITIRKGELKYE